MFWVLWWAACSWVFDVVCSGVVCSDVFLVHWFVSGVFMGLFDYFLIGFVVEFVSRGRVG